MPGARAVTVGAGKEWGLSLATPVIVKYRDEQDGRAHRARAMDPVASLDPVALTRRLVDIDSTTGRGRRGGGIGWPGCFAIAATPWRSSR